MATSPNIAQTKSVVLRIVAYGAEGSGKTATARALGEGLGQPVTSPESRPEGPTLLFDWMEYVGGQGDDEQIRTQLIAVSGGEPSEIRVALLRSADVVLFVADTTAGGVEATVASYEEAIQVLAALDEPRPPIVIQANKRDEPDALPIVEIRNALSLSGDATVVETVATTGRGVRQALDYAVRIGLERLNTLEAKAGPGVDLGPNHELTPHALLTTLAEVVNNTGPEPVNAPEEPVVEEPPAGAEPAEHRSASNPAPPRPLAELELELPAAASPDGGFDPDVWGDDEPVDDGYRIVDRGPPRLLDDRVLSRPPSVEDEAPVDVLAMADDPVASSDHAIDAVEQVEEVEQPRESDERGGAFRRLTRFLGRG